LAILKYLFKQNIHLQISMVRYQLLY